MLAKNVTKIEKQLKQALGADVLERLESESDFVIRERIITGRNLVPSMLKALGCGRVESIADLVRDFNYDNELSVCYKPYYERLDTPAFPKLMRGLFDSMTRNLSMAVLKPLKDGPFERFKEIFIQDGSSFALHDGLATTFPGRFTKISPAAVEIQMTMSLFADNSTYVEVTADSECERHYLPPADVLREALIIGDRGYDSTKYMQEVDDAGGSFLFRIRTNHDPRVIKIHRPEKRYRDLEGIMLSDALRRAPKNFSIELDMDVCWETSSGDLKNFSRVVVRWNPRDKEWVRLQANLSRDNFSARQIFQAYRLRWQIELLFKELKSYANLHKFCTRKETIAEGLIWASLCVAFLKRYFAHACEHAFGKQAISTRRVAMCGQMFLPDFCRALLKDVEEELGDVLRRVLTFLQSNGRRTNRRREKSRGRLAFGLKLVGAKS
jgi:hypothetical protein